WHETSHCEANSLPLSKSMCVPVWPPLSCPGDSSGPASDSEHPGLGQPGSGRARGSAVLPERWEEEHGATGNTLKSTFDVMMGGRNFTPGDVLQVDGPRSLSCSKIFFIECLPWDGARAQSAKVKSFIRVVKIFPTFKASRYLFTHDFTGPLVSKNKKTKHSSSPIEVYLNQQDTSVSVFSHV
uniref:Uncharacterized protein n=1 Tax=Myripristis murdjan TaxID=586833 RepID=A0A667YFD8_9TELE